MDPEDDEAARLTALQEKRKKERERYKKRSERRSMEINQERERKKLTRDSREKNNRNRSSNRRKKKVAPGRKSTKKKMPKELARTLANRKAIHNDVVRRLKNPLAHLGDDADAGAREEFVKYLGRRMYDPDVTKDDWLDWLESEVEQLRSTLRSERLINDE